MNESIGLDTSVLMSSLQTLSSDIKELNYGILPYLIVIGTAALTIFFGIYLFRVIKSIINEYR